jgi:hypothetical protein
MQLRTAPALEGVAWMRSGVSLLLRQPMAHLALMGFMFFTFGLLLGIQKVGAIAVLILMPSLNAGWVACNAALREGKLISPLSLLAPLRNAASRPKLLILGCLHALSGLAMLAFADVIDPDFRQHWGLVLRDHPADDASTEAAFSGLQSGMVLRLLCLLPVALLFWHAPVILHRLPTTSVAKALFASALASLRNLRPFAVYLMCWVLADIALSIVIGVLLSMIGGGSIAVFIMVPVMLLFSAAFYTSIHACVHGCLLFDDTSNTSGTT